MTSLSVDDKNERQEVALNFVEFPASQLSHHEKTFEESKTWVKK